MHIAVAIPIYKAEPTADERRSLQQCIQILGKYPIFLVSPDGMDTKKYDAIAQRQLNKQTFNPIHFVNINGYNQLLKDSHFYERFIDYDYVLIYQLDAWVFRDELEAWCNKGYDYIGSPWFERYHSHEEGYELWAVGNGGLSLRRIEACLAATKLPSSARIKSCKQIFQQEYHSICDLPRCLLRCLGPWIGTNSIRHIRKRLQEDGYFCIGLKGSVHQLHVPSPEEAAFFSFERSPKYLYEEITHHQLPFGCHAWRRYQYDEFWEQHIIL